MHAVARENYESLAIGDRGGPTIDCWALFFVKKNAELRLPRRLPYLAGGGMAADNGRATTALASVNHEPHR